jgi:shikimate kinase
MASPLPPEKPIALVGLMGAGKSSVGRLLARRLRLPFVDCDDEIEQAAGASIAEIFEQFGEAWFRDSERRVMARLIEGGPKVIATGGGAFIDEHTRRVMLDRCTVVWLSASPDQLVERVGRGRRRPLLDGPDPASVLRDLAEARNPIYAQAHLTIASDSLPVERVADAVVAALRQTRPRAWSAKAR